MGRRRALETLAALALEACTERRPRPVGGSASDASEGGAEGALEGEVDAGAARGRSAESRRALRAAFPVLDRSLPFVELGEYPTPVVQAPRLASAIGLGELWLKRDDLACSVYGGGKTRKLERLLGDALASGVERVITFGGVGSNQAVAVARFAGRLGLRAELLLAPQPPGPHVRTNLLAARAAGAELRLVPSVSDAEVAVARSARSRGAYVVPPGGDSALGDLAFVEAGLELARQVRVGACPRPERVYVALGTGGTAVGLALGLWLSGVDVPVVAVRASTATTSSSGRLRRAAARTVAFARRRDPGFPDLNLPDAALVVDGAHLGAGYGRESPEGRRVTAVAWETERLALEPVYTAKALAAVAADAHGLRGPVVFWCTQDAVIGAPTAQGDDEGVGVGDLPEPLRRYAVR